MEALSAINHAVKAAFDNRKLDCLAGTEGCVTSIFSMQKAEIKHTILPQLNNPMYLRFSSTCAPDEKPLADRLIRLRWKLSVPQHIKKTKTKNTQAHKRAVCTVIKNVPMQRRLKLH